MSGVQSLSGPLMKDLTIRKATTKDFDLFYPFFTKSIKDQFKQFTSAVKDLYSTDEYSELTIKKDISNKKKKLFLAFHNNTIVGYLLVAKPYGGVGFADWLAVDPSFQKHGIATLLLSLWEKDIIKEGGHVVQLWTSKNNIPFYKNRGYILIGEFPQAWFGVDYYHFYKPLALPEEKNYLREYLAKKKTKK
jgi:ribosomal protein S18 acetylase RimI-like enzyme